MADGFLIRPGQAGDGGVLHALIRELAEFEKLSAEMVATPQMISEGLSAGHVETLLAEVAGEAVGFALFFRNYSTFLGKPGLYLEDLYVRPQHRGAGIGKALLSAVAGVARERGCGRLDWSVLDWNQTAIDFYETFGARIQREWLLVRMDEAALGRMDEAALGRLKCQPGTTDK